MNPKFHQIVCIRTSFAIREENSLEDVSQITEIEDVVEFQRGWQEKLTHSSMKVQGCVDERLRDSLGTCSKFVQRIGQVLRENFVVNIEK